MGKRNSGKSLDDVRTASSFDWSTWSTYRSGCGSASLAALGVEPSEVDVSFRDLRERAEASFDCDRLGEFEGWTLRRFLDEGPEGRFLLLTPGQMRRGGPTHSMAVVREGGGVELTDTDQTGTGARRLIRVVRLTPRG